MKGADFALNFKLHHKSSTYFGHFKDLVYSLNDNNTCFTELSLIKVTSEFNGTYLII